MGNLKLLPKKTQKLFSNDVSLLQLKTNKRVELNVDKINELNPPKEDSRPKPTVPTWNIRGIKKKYAKNGSRLIKRIQK